MTDPRGVPDEVLVVDFVFIPHGAPEPEAWLRAHPETFSVPARMVWRVVTVVGSTGTDSQRDAARRSEARPVDLELDIDGERLAAAPGDGRGSAG